GFLPRSDGLIRRLLNKDPVLASECYGSAQSVGNTTAALLLQRSLQLLRSDDRAHRYVGCKCFWSSRINDPAAIAALETLALSDGEWLGCRIEACAALASLDGEIDLLVFVKLLTTASEVALRMVAVASITKRTGGVEDFALLTGVVGLL